MTEDYQEGYNAGMVVGAVDERLKIIRAILDNPNLVAECSFINDAGNLIFMPAKFISKLDGTPDPTLRED